MSRNHPSRKALEESTIEILDFEKKDWARAEPKDGLTFSTMAYGSLRAGVSLPHLSHADLPSPSPPPGSLLILDKRTQKAGKGAGTQDSSIATSLPSQFNLLPIFFSSKLNTCLDF